MTIAQVNTRSSERPKVNLRFVSHSRHNPGVQWRIAATQPQQPHHLEGHSTTNRVNRVSFNAINNQSDNQAVSKPDNNPSIQGAADVDFFIVLINSAPLTINSATIVLSGPIFRAVVVPR